MTTTFIYALCEPGTRTVRYIGKTIRVEKRLKEHLCKSIKHKSHLGDWLRLLVSRGEEPTLVVLRGVPGNGSEAEIRYIRLARGCHMDLVNATDGGEGVTMTPEILAKISAGNLGKIVSQKTRDRQSAAKLGLVRGPMSEEQKSKISRANTGQTSHNKGTPMPEAQKLKISVSNSGKNNKQFGVPRTEEERKAIGIGLRAYHIRRRAEKTLARS